MMTTMIRPDTKVPKSLEKRLFTKEAFPAAGTAERHERDTTSYFWAALRLGMGWIFLWAFLDKAFGLGFATEAGKGWIDGGSPTFGFLTFGTTGPFVEFYASIAGNLVVDWLFMLGILAVGLPLILGIGVRIAASIGVVMLMMMYSALLLPEHNPVLDDHIIYSVIMLGLAIRNPGYRLGLGRWWGEIKLVNRFPILE